MITITVVTSTRWTSRTRNSSSSPNNTDVASDMLVASLLDVVEDQQHVGATSLSTATTRASRHPAQVRRAALWRATSRNRHQAVRPPDFSGYSRAKLLPPLQASP